MGHTSSYYAASAGPIPERPELLGEVQADVAIVGGGFTGLSAALDLAKAGFKVVVLEAKQVGWGASGRNGGQMWTGFSKDMDEVEATVGLDHAKALFPLALEAKALIAERIAEFGIDCDFKPGLFEAALKPSHLDDMAMGIHHMVRTYGYEAYEFCNQEQAAQHVRSDSYLGGRYDREGGHLHPLKYALGLAQACESLGVEIFERSPVTAWDDQTLCTAKGHVTAKFRIFAGNALLEGLVPSIRPYQMPVGTYMIATEPMGEARAAKTLPSDAAIGDWLFALNYYRMSADKRMLWGGRVSYSRLAPASIEESMRKIMLTYLPQLSDLKVDYAWGGYVSITVNRLPHLGRLDANTYYAQGFSGQGVALTGLAGRSLAMAVQG